VLIRSRRLQFKKSEVAPACPVGQELRLAEK